VPNKNGVAPPLYGFVAGTDIDIGLRVNRDGRFEINSERGRNQDRLNDIMDAYAKEPSAFIFELDVNPHQREMSRFLAKMALEAVALRFSHSPELLDLIIDDTHYDRIRNWARRGDNLKEWPYHQRRIYPEETLMHHPKTKEWVQAGFGYDLFVNRRRETYFAFCLYGHEFVINVGGPSIKGFLEWLGACPRINCGT
jgi:hypothetical protein